MEASLEPRRAAPENLPLVLGADPLHPANGDWGELDWPLLHAIRPNRHPIAPREALLDSPEIALEREFDKASGDPLGASSPLDLPLEFSLECRRDRDTPSRPPARVRGVAR